LLWASTEGNTVIYGSQDTKRVFGQWLELHHSRRELWPKKLDDWYESRGGDAANGKGLTDEMLLEWMAEETGWPELKEDYFLRLYRRQKQWSRGKKEGRENLLLAVAIAKVKLLTVGSGVDRDRVDDIEVILNVLRGVFNPFA
jgi:hypothetical protein